MVVENERQRRWMCEEERPCLAKDEPVSACNLASEPCAIFAYGHRQRVNRSIPSEKVTMTIICEKRKSNQ